jgi:hypothetical protein
MFENKKPGIETDNYSLESDSESAKKKQTEEAEVFFVDNK